MSSTAPDTESGAAPEKPRPGPATATLRRGWSTGCCAALAAKAATLALLGRGFPERVAFRLPGGEVPELAPIRKRQGKGWAECGIIKDAGDDPDVTHGATIVARVAHTRAGRGTVFRAGPGVGRVTLPGLPLAVGEPAINPTPRRMILAAIAEAAAAEPLRDVVITLSVPGGAALARRTWNPRLGILGGISILGTTGIVRPFSCSAWIASIHRGVDVAVARGSPHVIAATGARSEAAARRRHGLAEADCLDMGDFVGGTLKYLRRHPVPRLTLAGGVGKFTKLALGALDLHSARSQVDFARLAAWLEERGVDAAGVRQANTVLEVSTRLGLPYAGLIAMAAQERALAVLGGAAIEVETLVCDREGGVLATAPFRLPPPR